MVALSGLGRLLSIAKKTLQIVFNNSVNNYWHKKIAKITPHNSKNMFPQINTIFRHKNIEEIPNFETSINLNPLIIDNPDIDSGRLGIRGDNYIVTRKEDKANLLVKHFANINNSTGPSASSALERIITKTIQDFNTNNINDSNNKKTVTTFNNNNKENNPNFEIDNSFFCKTHTLKLIIKKLNNKKSFVYDKIPNTAIKNLPECLVDVLVILFNNALNNSYFPIVGK